MEVLYMMGLRNESIEEAAMLTMEKKKRCLKVCRLEKNIKPNTSHKQSSTFYL